MITQEYLKVLSILEEGVFLTMSPSQRIARTIMKNKNYLDKMGNHGSWHVDDLWKRHTKQLRSLRLGEVPHDTAHTQNMGFGALYQHPTEKQLQVAANRNQARKNTTANYEKYMDGYEYEKQLLAAKRREYINHMKNI